jgi:hypothetical protein
MPEETACLLVHNSNSSGEHSREKYLPTLIQVFEKDVKVCYESPQFQHDRETRSEIELFSPASQRRLLFVARNSGHKIKSQMALTYHKKFPSDGKECKRHMNILLTRLRKKYPDVDYLWVFEFQSRGAAHYHLFTSVEHTNSDFQKDIAKWWNAAVDPENEVHLKWHQHPDNFFAWNMESGNYLAKQYLAKASQKEIPEEFQNVGRFWGNSKSMKPQCDLILPDDIPEEVVHKIVRATKKYRESVLKRFLKRPVNLRKIHRSINLALCSGVFAQILSYYTVVDNSTRLWRVLF